MRNVELIDEKQFFTESRKAIQIVLEKETELNKKLKTHELLDLVKNRKKETPSMDEYSELEKLEKELELKIRFNNYNIPAVPEEHVEKIKRNSEIEEKEVVELLNVYKKELNEMIVELENGLLPLVTNIAKLEKMRSIPNQIDVILTSEIGEDVPFTVNYTIGIYKGSSESINAAKAVKEIANAIDHLNKVKTVTERRSFWNLLKGVKD